MNKRNVTVFAVLHLFVASGIAERLPDPVDFLTGVIVFSEHCAMTYPNMRDAKERVIGEMRDDERAMLAEVMKSPRYETAVAAARAETRNMPAWKVQRECRALYNK